MSYTAFMDGVRWVCTQLEAAATTIQAEKRGDVQARDGRIIRNVIVESGQPAFALKLRQMSEALKFHGAIRARELYPMEKQNDRPDPEPVRSVQAE